MTRRRSPTDRADGKPSDAEIFHMTVRHGADHTKRYLHSLALAVPSDEEHCERWRRLGSDLLRHLAQAEVLPFPQGKEPELVTGRADRSD